MKCENVLCIYQTNGACLLEEIELDCNGSCASCLLLHIADNSLDKLKDKDLQELKSKCC